MSQLLLTPQPLTRAQKTFCDAFACLLLETGFDRIRVTDIISRAGFSRSAFYTHYADKYDLAESILEREIHIFVHYSLALEKGGEYTQLLTIITKYMTHVYENRVLFNAIMGSRFPGVSIMTLYDMINSRLNGSVSSDKEEAGDSFDPGFKNYMGIYESFLHINYWRLHDYSFTPEQMARKILALTVRQNSLKEQ